jgi:hypothetical protein
MGSSSAPCNASWVYPCSCIQLGTQLGLDNEDGFTQCLAVVDGYQLRHIRSWPNGSHLQGHLSTWSLLQEILDIST